MAGAAALLSIPHAASYQRYETGENRPDAPMMVRIRLVTDREVTLDDLHEQRLAWLLERRPDLVLEYPELSAEAAE